MNIPFYQVDSPWNDVLGDDISWILEYLKKYLNFARWAGLKEINVAKINIQLIESVNLSKYQYKEIKEHDFFGFLLAKLNFTKKFLFILPVQIMDGYNLSTNQNQDTKGIFFVKFKNGVKKTVSFNPLDGSFWLIFLKLAIKTETFPEFLTIDIENNQFTSKVKELLTSEIVSVDILGGGDTTNIVLLIHSNKEDDGKFILKFFPKLSFNTGFYKHSILERNGFDKYAKFLGEMDYSESFFRKNVKNCMEEPNITKIESFCTVNQLNLMKFFPFIHFIEHIDNEMDGGTPFWNAAVKLTRDEDPVEIDYITESYCKRVSQCVGEFHKTLEKAKNLVHISEKSVFSRFITDLNHKIEIVTRSKPEQYLPSRNDNLKDIVDQALNVIKLRFSEPEFINGLLELNPDQFYNRTLCIHQDLHLAQFIIEINTGEYKILDLEGDPQSSWVDNIDEWPIEKDIAAVIRSFSYIKYFALKDYINLSGLDYAVSDIFPIIHDINYQNFFKIEKIDEKIENIRKIKKLLTLLREWEKNAMESILKAYIMPFNRELIRIFLIHRVLSEISYELNHRQQNVLIPLMGLIEIIFD